MKTINTQKATDATKRQQYISLPHSFISALLRVVSSAEPQLIFQWPRKKKEREKAVQFRLSSPFFSFFANQFGVELWRWGRGVEYKPDLNQTS